MNSPDITVLMPFHNAARHLDEAIDSILGQTHVDFELLAIDDGSTDGGAAKLASRHDPRIRVVQLTPNRGVIGALNHGLSLARGRFIARMDADDIAEPTRLARQLEFFSSHPNVGVLGTDFTSFGDRVGPGWIRYHDDANLRIALLFENPLCHPTVMIRRSILEQTSLRYPREYLHAEEYALWMDISRHTRLANLPDKLLRYRTHAAQVSRVHSRQQCASIDRLVLRQLDALGAPRSQEDLRIHHLFGSGFFPRPRLDRAMTSWRETLLAANARTGVYPQDVFASQLLHRQSAALERHTRILGELRLDQRLRWRLSSWLRSL